MQKNKLKTGATMSTKRNITRALILLGIAILQLIGTQVVTFLISFLIPIENFIQTQPVIFIIVLGLTYSIGVFGTGWLAIKVRWLKIEPQLTQRLIGTVAGAYVPLLIALLVYHPLEAGNPFYLVAAMVSIVGFYLAGLGR
jgi:hypothetical protein